MGNRTLVSIPDAEGVDSSVALTLRKDYLRQLCLEKTETEITLDEIWVQAYYGTYSGSQELYVHKDSHFYTLNEAYDAGYITKEDVEAFGPKINSTFRKWEK